MPKTLLDRRGLSTRPSSGSLANEQFGLPSGPRRQVGHFRIEEKLGEGGVGTVYLGFDQRLERRVALKALRPEIASDAKMQKRFLREARLLSQLRHPNICQVHDLIEEGDERWLVLEYIEGRTLSEAISDLTFEAKLEVAAGVAEAIAVAHRERIVHRDLKPENIMLVVEGGVKVLDFGLARSTGARRHGQEESGSGEPHRANWAGTLLYMSPEQARHEKVREASDVFSFGLVLQELFTGQPAYPTLPTFGLMERVRRGETLPLVGLDPELTELIQGLLTFEPESRPSARQAAEALLQLRERPARRRRRRLKIAGAATLALVLLAALASAFATRKKAARQVALAQQFTREASDIEWLLRSAYLGPAQDLRPLRRQVRDRMDALRQRMVQVGDVGRGPGEYALGRAAVALGDHRRAWEHFDLAWRHDYRPPEMATALGLAGLEVYRLEARRLRSVVNSERRTELQEKLEGEWLMPALARLDQGRKALRRRTASGISVRSKAESAEYVDAIVALDMGNQDEALEHARLALHREPGLYEAELVVARIHQSRGEAHEAQGEDERVNNAYELARQAYRRAGELGRSDPAVHLESCALELVQIAYTIYGGDGAIEPYLRSGEAACQLARRLDEDNPKPWRLLSELRMRRAEVISTGEELEADLASAAELAREAIRRQGDNADAWRSLGHVYSVLADGQLAHYQDASEALEQMIAAYSEAYRLAPRTASTSNALGNAYSMRASALFEYGIDARADTQRALAAYKAALELAPGHGYESNMALAYARRAIFEVDRGLDARDSVNRGRAAQKIDLDADPEYSNGLVNMADLESVAVLDAARRGTAAHETLIRAISICQRAFTLQPNNTRVIERCLTLMLTLSELSLLCGNEDTTSELTTNLLEENDHTVAVIERGQASFHRLEATRDFVSGQDPTIELEHARKAHLRAIELDAGLVLAHLEGGRIALLAASWRLAQGKSASADLAAARTAFNTVAEMRPQRFEADLARVQLALLRGAFAGDAAAFAEAGDLLKSLRRRAPGLGEVESLRQWLTVAQSDARKTLDLRRPDLILSPFPCPPR